MYKSTLVVASALLAACTAASAQNPRPEEIIALERAALDRWGKGDPRGYIELFGAEVTYFDPFAKRRLDGIDELKKLLEPLAGKIKVARYEMLNPKVQFYGDVAVLTFNLVNYNAAGQESNRWNSTEVYARDKSRWKLVHSHWSWTTPELKTPATPN
jgi:ketosteroid isomerase-like protein